MSSVDPNSQLRNIISGISDENKRVQYTKDKGYQAIDKKARKGRAKNQSTLETLINVDAFVQENAGKLQADDLRRLHKAIQTRKNHLEKKQRGFFFRLFASGKTWDKISKALTALNTLDTHVQDAKTTERVQTAARGAGAFPKQTPGKMPATEAKMPETQSAATTTSAAPIVGGAPPPPPPPTKKKPLSTLHKSAMKTADLPRFVGEPAPPKLRNKDHDLGKPESLGKSDKDAYKTAIKNYILDLEKIIAQIQSPEKQKLRADFFTKTAMLSEERKELQENLAKLEKAREALKTYEEKHHEGLDIVFFQTGKDGQPFPMTYHADASKAPTKRVGTKTEVFSNEALIQTVKNKLQQKIKAIEAAKKNIPQLEKDLQELEEQNLGISFRKWDDILKEKLQTKKFWGTILEKIEGKKTNPKVEVKQKTTTTIIEPRSPKEEPLFYEQKMGAQRFAGWSLSNALEKDWSSKTN